MELLQPRDLVLVSHQAFWHTKDEQQTGIGHKQSQISGQWIAKHILAPGW